MDSLKQNLDYLGLSYLRDEFESLLADAAKKNIPEGTPGMKAFIDDVWSYSTNEITIYWNSPLVLLFSLLS